MSKADRAGAILRSRPPPPSSPIGNCSGQSIYPARSPAWSRQMATVSARCPIVAGAAHRRLPALLRRLAGRGRGDPRSLIPDALLAVPGRADHGHRSRLSSRTTSSRYSASLGEIGDWARWHAAQGAFCRILHIDTGMSRLGLIDRRELAVLPSRATRGSPASALRYAMTHLVASELRTDPLNDRQRQRFADACAKAPARTAQLRQFVRHLSRPRLPAFRPGATRGRALRHQPDTERGEPDEGPTVRLRARVLTVRDVPPGTSVGYNATWHASRPEPHCDCRDRLCRRSASLASRIVAGRPLTARRSRW